MPPLNALKQLIQAVIQELKEEVSAEETAEPLAILNVAHELTLQVCSIKKITNPMIMK